VKENFLMRVFQKVRDKGVGPWLLNYAATPLRRRPRRPGEAAHVLLCLADHYEPKADNAPQELARQRVRNWAEQYPRRFGHFRDSDGRPPRHTFFYPPEEYEPQYLDDLTGVCQAGFGEVEIHLHHRHDTAETLRDKLTAFRDLLSSCHRQLARDRHTGELAYGFVHGNWSLCNSRPDGDWCGVNDELTVLRQTGCYADFTLPSAPSPTQTAKINSLYYARSRPDRPRGHDRGVDVGSGPAPEGSLLLVQGPLLLDWGNRKWGLMPRLENGCVQGSQPPTLRRVGLWMRARVRVPSRPDWFFVKLHAHGAQEESQAVLLGDAMVRFHEGLAGLAGRDARFHFHYVTAREMANLVAAAEAGWQGSVADARDYRLVWNGKGTPSALPEPAQSMPTSSRV
jgi:hypothetical protein